MMIGASVTGNRDGIAKISRLFDELNARAIDYCHWKSNWQLSEALAGMRDLDLYVLRKHACSFESLLNEMGFRRGEYHSGVGHQSSYHFYVLDEASGKIVHLHVCYSIFTGGSVVKSHRLPVEEMLLRNDEWINNVKVPGRGAELALFVLRKILESGSIIESLFMLREKEDIRRELEWLDGEESRAEALDLLNAWLPIISQSQFLQVLTSLKGYGTLMGRFVLGWRIRRFLKGYCIYGSAALSVRRTFVAVRLLWLRILRRRDRCYPSAGGAVIAFVGSEASGKSTVVSVLKNWLGEYFEVKTAHSGKPRSSWLTIAPRMLLPILRRLFPMHRLNVVETEASEAKRDDREGGVKITLLFLFRSLMVAYDQSRELKKVFREASSGKIVLCDRYPSSVLGGMDGPRVDPEMFSPRQFLKRTLARREKILYQDIPKPDLVFLLRVPVELAVARNAHRVKKDGAEPEEYVRQRYKLLDKWSIPKTNIHTIDNARQLENVLAEIKEVVWRNL
jgi:thymidylate kinase